MCRGRASPHLSATFKAGKFPAFWQAEASVTEEPLRFLARNPKSKRDSSAPGAQNRRPSGRNDRFGWWLPLEKLNFGEVGFFGRQSIETKERCFCL